MTGSLQVKNDKYYMVFSWKENRKWKTKWVATGLSVKGNKRKAEQLLREKLRELDSSSQVNQSEMLFSDYIQKWLDIAQRRVDSVTYQGYELMAKSQVIPFFKCRNTKLIEVDVALLQMFFDEKATSGRKDGNGGLSPASLRQYKNILNQTLNEAVKVGLIPANPCQMVELPKKKRYESTYYTAAQIKRLLSAIQDDVLYPLVSITLMYGLRRSEVLGLKWDCVDFENNTLTIRRTVSRVTKTVEKDKTKNEASRRSFPLTLEARKMLLAVKGSEAEARNHCGKEYEENDYVFKWYNGKPFSPDFVSAHFSLLLKKHNLPHIRFHELRHSCASLLLNNGCTLKDVQEYMGHADIQMTANIYGHLDKGRKEMLASTVTDSLFTAV